MATAPFYPSTHPARPLHPAFSSFLRYVLAEGRALILRLIAYLGALGVMAITAAHLYTAIPPAEDSIALRTGDKWAAAARPTPAFDVPAADLIAKSVTYDISRHPDGGRRDSLRWFAESEARPLAELEIYRPGGERAGFAASAAALAELVNIPNSNGLQPAGVIDSKFGAVPLLSFRRDGQMCLGFMIAFDEPRLQLSGWTCTGDVSVQRSQMVCALDRLTILSAGNDARLAELFAHAELRRGKCATNTGASDWIISADGPQLRGSGRSN